MEGGDRATLTPWRPAVNNDIHHMGRWSARRPGIMVRAGHRIAHNHIHHGLHGIQRKATTI